MPYTCIIIDDDEIDRLTTQYLAGNHASLQIEGVYSSAVQALPFIASHQPEILFLDIDMPEMSGLELRKALMQVPVCIFVTSHPEHALESFDLDTLDFLVKPVKQERFAQAVQRIENYMELRQKASFFEATVGGDAIYLKEGREQVKVKLHDILYLEALKDYTLVVTSQKKHCILSNLGTMLKEPHFNSFVRIHRSFAVQKEFIQKINAAEVILHNYTVLPLGRSFKNSVEALLQ
jgi:DNA-binding LytR/AlgR family response regulator